MCICVYLYMCICVYVCMFTCVYMYMCVYVYIYMCICVYVHMCVYVYMCTCVYAYMCIWLILKTSAVSRTEFQSAIFELSQRVMAKSIPINLKALWVVIEKNKSYFHLHCILQCKSVSQTEQRKTFNFRKIFDAGTL